MAFPRPIKVKSSYRSTQAATEYEKQLPTPTVYTEGGGTGQSVFGGKVGTVSAPESDANATRPDTDLPVYWIMENGVTPTNALGPDLIWNAP